MVPVPVDVWSDIACPWCWVGKRHLERAAELAGLDLEVTWHAFELDPRAPREAPDSVDYADRLARKYRTDRDGGQAMIDRMVDAGASAGVEMRFDRIRPSNSFDAHRLLCWARGGGRQTELAERLFAAYLREGRALSDRDALIEIAADCGLDAAAAAEILDGDRFASDVRVDELQAARLGVTGVPFFVFDRRFALSGAHPPESMREVLLEANAGLEASVADGPACEPDGCDDSGNRLT